MEAQRETKKKGTAHEADGGYLRVGRERGRLGGFLGGHGDGGGGDGGEQGEMRWGGEMELFSSEEDIRSEADLDQDR